jgi:hypothetical protein
LVVETWLADLAGTVLPGDAVLHLAGSVNERVHLAAFRAFDAVEVEAALHVALAALEFEVRQAISALATLISHTTQLI